MGTVRMGIGIGFLYYALLWGGSGHGDEIFFLMTGFGETEFLVRRERERERGWKFTRKRNLCDDGYLKWRKKTYNMLVIATLFVLSVGLFIYLILTDIDLVTFRIFGTCNSSKQLCLL